MCVYFTFWHITILFDTVFKPTRLLIFLAANGMSISPIPVIKFECSWITAIHKRHLTNDFVAWVCVITTWWGKHNPAPPFDAREDVGSNSLMLALFGIIIIKIKTQLQSAVSRAVFPIAISPWIALSGCITAIKKNQSWLFFGPRWARSNCCHMQTLSWLTSVERFFVYWQTRGCNKLLGLGNEIEFKEPKEPN